jgi:hypothetical protein
MRVHGMNAIPQWQVQGIGLLGTCAQPIRGRRAVASRGASMLYFNPALNHTIPVLFIANIFGF